MLVTVLVIIIVVLASFIYFLIKELKRITRKLEESNKGNLDVEFRIKSIERLIHSINKDRKRTEELRIKSDRAQGELKALVSSISHDLRTPLTSILGYIQMAQSKDVSEEKKLLYIEKSEKKARNLQVLISEFFMISVIESNEYKLNIERVDLTELSFDIITSYYNQFEKKGLELNLKIEDECIIYADRVAIQRVIENLIGNTLKHAKKDISFIVKKDSNNVIIEFSNNANGIKDKEVKLLFNKFYKTDISRSNSENNGLGLAIVKGLVEKMNGSVKASLVKNKLYISCTFEKRS